MGKLFVTIGDKPVSDLGKLDIKEIEEFLEIVKRTSASKPSQKDLSELKKWMNTYPKLWKEIFDISHVIEENFINNMVSKEILVLAMQKNTDEIRTELDYSQSSMMEQMLIDNLVISWLGVQYAAFQVTTRMNKEEKIIILEFWEKRLSIAQQRYLRACETLTRVRRLMSGKPAVQVNIATQGGQQVNVAGDAVKK